MMEKSKTSLDSKQTATISLGDFMRIRNTIIPSISEEEEKKKKEAILKEQSQQKVKQWPDSLEMAKKNKLEQKKKNFIEKEVNFRNQKRSKKEK